MVRKIVSIIFASAVIATAFCLTGCASDADCPTGRSENNPANNPVSGTTDVGGNGVYTVHVKNHIMNKSVDLKVNSGETVTVESVKAAYKEAGISSGSGFMCDEYIYMSDGVTKFDGAVTRDMYLTFCDSYSPEDYGRIVFNYNGDEYKIYRRISDRLRDVDFSVSAYGYGYTTDFVFYSDAEHTKPLEMDSVKIKRASEGDTVIYVGNDDYDYTVTLINVFIDDAIFILHVHAGDDVTMKALYDAYYYDPVIMSSTGFFRDEHFYTDKACRTKFIGGVNSDITLYFNDYNPTEYGEIDFVYGGENYVVYRKVGIALTAEDFSRSAYGIGEPNDYMFYSDDAHKSPLDLNAFEFKCILEGDTTIYVGDAA